MKTRNDFPVLLSDILGNDKCGSVDLMLHSDLFKTAKIESWKNNLSFYFLSHQNSQQWLCFSAEILASETSEEALTWSALGPIEQL